ncbi:hypothetical protein [Gorillibacterium sp. sgz5001074]|uniref:hypothetical protein n=1 Tax=Gorillibacterium sp. sgz5001074 TaxID=3446695 RepID=UPI003F66153D
MINHINIPDGNGHIYCCLRNRIVTFDEAHREQYCSGCRMLNGDAGGSGVECLWDDIRETESNVRVVTDPVREWESNQKKRVRTLMAEWNSQSDYGTDEAVI